MLVLKSMEGQTQERSAQNTFLGIVLLLVAIGVSIFGFFAIGIGVGDNEPHGIIQVLEVAAVPLILLGSAAFFLFRASFRRLSVGSSSVGFGKKNPSGVWHVLFAGILVAGSIWLSSWLVAKMFYNGDPSYGTPGGFLDFIVGWVLYYFGFKKRSPVWIVATFVSLFIIFPLGYLYLMK